MKRIAILLLVLAMTAVLCACGCTNKEPAATPTDGINPSTQTDNMPTDTMTIPVPETNVPDTGVDNETMPDSSNGGTDGAANEGTDGGTSRAIERFHSPMSGMQ